MMATRLLHPQMLERLERDFFVQECRIEMASDETDEYGQELADNDESKWSVVVGMERIACRVGAPSGGKRQTPEMTVTDATNSILLVGSFPNITTQMRAVVDGRAYSILLPAQEAEGKLTRLTVKIVE